MTVIIIAVHVVDVSSNEIAICMNSKLGNQMHAIGFQFAETNKSVNLFLFCTNARM